MFSTKRRIKNASKRRNGLVKVPFLEFRTSANFLFLLPDSLVSEVSCFTFWSGKRGVDEELMAQCFRSWALSLPCCLKLSD